MFSFRNKRVLVKKSENLIKYGPFFIIFPLPVVLKFTCHTTAVHLFTCVAKAVTSRRSREFSENWSNAEKFHVKLRKIEHGDISFLFHKLIVHA